MDDFRPRVGAFSRTLSPQDFSKARASLRYDLYLLPAQECKFCPFLQEQAAFVGTLLFVSFQLSRSVDRYSASTVSAGIVHSDKL